MTVLPVSSQFATGSLVAKDILLPEVGERWKMAERYEVLANCAENMAILVRNLLHLQ